MRKIVLLAGDSALFFFALFLAISTRRLEIVSWEYYKLNLDVFLPIFLFSVVVYFLFDLYSLRMLQGIYRSVYYLFIAVVVNLILAIAFLYVFKAEALVSPKTVLVLYSILLLLLTVVWRFLYYDFFFSSAKYLKKVLIIGSDKACAELRQLANPPKGVDYQIVGFVSVDEKCEQSPFSKVTYLGNFKDTQKIIQEHKIEEVIVAFDYKNNPHFIKWLSDALMLNVKFFEWPVFYEQIFQKVPTNEIDHFWFIYAFSEQDKKIYERIKRALDIIVSAVGIFFLVLILPFIALAIKLTSPGAVFYRQKRVGLNGQLFTLVKFRTMTQNAEKNGAVWAAKGDARVTSIGKFLRKTRIDELPQFLNILWGEMSLVGPRPERPEFLPVLSQKIPFYYKRHMVKPGVTGFAQVMFPYAATVEDSLEKVGYDLFYIKNRSFYLYIKIVLLTLRTVLSMGGR